MYVFATGSTYQREGARNSCNDLGAAVLCSVVLVSISQLVVCWRALWKCCLCGWSMTFGTGVDCLMSEKRLHSFTLVYNGCVGEKESCAVIVGCTHLDWKHRRR